MLKKVKDFYKNLSFESMLIGQLLIFTTIAAFAITVFVGYSNKNERQNQEFVDKCAAACYPNTVYSTDFKRCACNANVVVREVK